MEQTYFTEKVSKINLLTVNELLIVYQSFDDDMFPTKRRSMERVVCCRCDLDTYNLSGREHSGLNDCLDFITNLGVIMLGIKVFGSISYWVKHDISLTILKSSEVLRSINTCLYSTKGQEIYPVLFDKPLCVKEDTRYTIQLNMKGQIFFTGKHYRATILSKKLSVTFSNSSFSSTNSISVNMGQISGIIIQHIYIYKK